MASNHSSMNHRPPQAFMTIEELLKFPHSPFNYNGINKQLLKKIPLQWNEEGTTTFNELIDLCNNNGFRWCDEKPSGSISNGGELKLLSRCVVNYSPKKQSCELIIASTQFGCYRFILGHSIEHNENKGTYSIMDFYQLCDEFNIDLSQFALTKEQGYLVKKTIKSPRIECLTEERSWHYGVHHLDLNSSYFSRIAEKRPILRPLIEYIYTLRHTDNKKYKDLLNLTQGIMQSEFCPNYFDRKNKWRRVAPYQFANLSRDAVNGNRELIDFYVEKLKEAGRTPLLVNTDGIWYEGEIYHDTNEGAELGQWRNDYTNCSLVIRSKGCYQFYYEGKTYTRARGCYKLEMTLPREQWELGQILTLESDDVLKFGYNPFTRKVEKTIYG